MGVPVFGTLKLEKEQQQLNLHMLKNSYVVGVNPTQDDATVASLLSASPDSEKFPHAARWYRHIASFNKQERSKWPKGQMAPPSAAAKEDDDDLDLFGEESEESKAEAKAKKEKLQTEMKKKAAKPAIIARSTLVLSIRPTSLHVNLDKLIQQIKEIKIEGVTWGEAAKKVPICFGLFNIQMSCTIIDDLVNTDDVILALASIGMTDEEKTKKREQFENAEEDDEEDEDEDEETEEDPAAEVRIPVKSAEILSFNKL